MRFALLAAVVVIATAVALVSLPEPASADHGDSANINRCFKAGPYYATKADGCRAGDAAVVRNLVVGESIPVCSDAYEESTKAAIAQWNAAIHPGVFVWRGSVVSCLYSRYGAPRVASVIVVSVTPNGGVLHGINTAWGPCTTSNACAIYQNLWQDPRSGGISPWYAITGQTEVRVNAKTHPESSDGTAKLQRIIAHELGHALALGDRDAVPAQCDTSTGLPKSIMARGLLSGDDQTKEDCESSSITRQDLADYAEIYTPGRPMDFKAVRDTSVPDRVTFA